MAPKGLTESEVLESRKAHGVNVMTPPAKEPLWKLYLEKFKDPLILILLVAGALSLGIAFYEKYALHEGNAVFFEPTGIFIAILLATGLAFIFELRADREFQVLNKVDDDEMVAVIRAEGPTMIPKKDVVVGDILVLSQGEEIPADAALLESMALNVDESTLTGEPSCMKSADEKDPEATFPTDHVLRGTRILEGHGIARVFAVGDHTENGKVFKASKMDDSVKTPLNEQLERLGGLITKASYVIAGLIIVGRITVWLMADQAMDVGFLAYLLQSVMIAVTLIVVAVPEGLPMAVTLALAYSMSRMLQTNNLVRKMHACETMGATTVICTDKTGTLTQNRMTVSEFFTEAAMELVYKIIALDSTAQVDAQGHAIGNPTEAALLSWLIRHGVSPEELRREAVVEKEIPFSTQRKYMAVQVSIHDARYLFVKGAPEIVLDMCDASDKEEIREKLVSWQKKGMRTLGFAYKELAPEETAIEDNELRGKPYRFAAICAIADPVREDVPDAIRECRDAGIDVKIVTGDTRATAEEIGRQCGIGEGLVLTGPEVEAMSDEELREKAKDIRIIARARPMDKEKLVRALQADGEVVAVTGDGTNDAPALKTAHVGLSMGDGTSVAKEASDITIIDNSFASIGRAAMWGRSLYANIQRFILFQLTVNVAACLTVLVGAFTGLESPLTVTQMLWVNLIMDTFAAMALASLPPRPEVMKEKPRNREDFIITRSMYWFIGGVGGLFFILLFTANMVFSRDILALGITDPEVLEKVRLTTAGAFFTLFVMLQWWNLFNARAWATGQSAFHFKGCGAFIFIQALILVGQIVIVNFGGRFFNLAPIPLSAWLMIIVGTSPVLIIGELLRAIRRQAR